MRDLMSVALALFLCGSSPPCHARQRQPLEGNWTGGFWLKGNWVAINIRFNSQNESPKGTADIVFPSYGGSQSMTNVTLSNLKQSSADLHFEIPFREERVVFDGRHEDGTISGDYHYNEEKGSFGLTRVTNVTVESLEKHYGAYRVSPDRVISIFRAWGDPRTLNYVDYRTGQIGTLWASSENEFFSGPGRTSFPIAVKVSFDKDTSGNVKSLLWQSPDEANLIARKIEAKEERLTFKNGDITLGGTLILPETKGRHAVVIVTPGDFGINRNVLRMWAENFVSRGIAALVFDSRGGGESTGIVDSNSFSDLANDVLAIVESLKTREDINPRQIGLFGFSNSCWTITLAASRSKDVGFLILQSMSGVPPWKQESYRAETQLRADGLPERTVKQGADFMRLKFEAARTGAGWEQIQKIMNEAAGERWLAYTNPPRSLERLQQRWPTLWTYSPVPALENLKIPVLAYWGDKDTYVPAQESIAIFEQAMAKAGNKNYVVKVYPNGSHSLLKTDSGGPSTEAKEIKFMPGFWKMQTDWLLNHVSIPI